MEPFLCGNRDLPFPKCLVNCWRCCFVIVAVLVVYFLIHSKGMAEGIPEPSLTFYGSIRNTALQNRLVTDGVLVWRLRRITSGRTVTLTAPVNVLSSQTCYILEVPCETIVSGSVASNALDLVKLPVFFDRSEVFWGDDFLSATNRAILAGSVQTVFALSSTNRGRIDQIDLLINSHCVDSEPNGLCDWWEQKYGIQGLYQASGDPDGDGRSNLDEFYDDTNPLEADSPTPPEIVEQPSNQTIYAGTVVLFTVSARGSVPLTYQWKFNGTNIAGATNSAFTLTNGLASHQGNYRVSITNQAGSINSSNASLTILPLPSVPLILQYPESQAVPAGSNVLFSVKAVGVAPLRYQWKFNTTNINAATNSTLTLINVSLNNQGNYSVTVSNNIASIVSTAAVLSVQQAPFIIQEPQNQSVMAGTNVLFSVLADGSGPLIYQWKFNGTNLVGATSSILMLTNVSPVQDGYYVAIITNAYGGVTSTNVHLSVSALPPGPRILQGPEDRTNYVGGNVTFFVTTTGIEPLSYRWLFNDVPMIQRERVSGVASSMLMITNLQLADAGGYRLVISNGLGAATSSVAMLVVKRARLDFNFDGRPDFLWMGTNGQLQAWFMNQTNLLGSKLLRNGTSVAPVWKMGGQSDLNGDGHADFVWQNNDGRLAIWYMSGSNFLHSSVWISGPPHFKQIVRGLEDFNGDGNRDIVWQNAKGYLSVWFLNGTNRVGSSLIRAGTAPKLNWRFGGMGDFNNDRHTDILWHSMDGRLAVWLLNQTNYVGAVTLRGGQPSAPGWTVLGLSDVNDDGQNDILWQNGKGSIAVWFMNQTNFLRASPLLNGKSINPRWKWAGPK